MGPELDTVVVRGVVAGGDGIGRLADGRVVLCEGALPGERVAVTVVERRRDHARARVVDVLDPSPLRVDPPCPHLARGCGGCTWQHVRPGGQLMLKAAIVADALRHIGGLPDVAVAPAPPERGTVPLAGYRTSLRLAVDSQGRPAYRRRHAHDLVAVDSCLVAHPRLAELVADARFPGASEVVLRVGAGTGERLAHADRASGRAKVPLGTAVSSPPGRPAVVHEVVDGRRWRVSATSFFQSGPEAAEVLVAAVRAALGADVGPGAVVADLYAGVGLLGGSVAAQCAGASLVAVESQRGAARDAAANLDDVGARVIVGEVAEACRRGAVRGPRGRAPDVVVADPARGGLGPSAATAVAGLGAPLVVLVSCDPASLARDATLLGALGYRLESVEVLDLFPATFHVEAVSRFVRASVDRRAEEVSVAPGAPGRPG